MWVDFFVECFEGHPIIIIIYYHISSKNSALLIIRHSLPNIVSNFSAKVVMRICYKRE